MLALLAHGSFEGGACHQNISLSFGVRNLSTNCNYIAQGPGEDVTDAMARIYVWLRYSSSRQLTWQRNYNTQPRILGEAQKRLTDTIAKVCLHSYVTFAKKTAQI